MRERWTDITDFEGIYQVSSMGRIKRLPFEVTNPLTKTLSTFPGGVLSPYLDKRTGYLLVALCDKTTKKREAVHRLVARAHVPNPDNKPWVNHKKGIKTDNRASQLEWATPAENSQHAWSTGLITHAKGEAWYNSKLKEREVFEIREKYSPNNYTYKMLSQEYGVNTSSIMAIVKHKNWKHI